MTAYGGEPRACLYWRLRVLHALDALGLTAALTAEGQTLYGASAHSQLPAADAPETGALFMVVGHRQTEEYSLQGRAFRLLASHDLVRR